MDIDWGDLEYFDAAREAGSFSAAAARLGVGQATVSRRIAGLESELGHQLFERLPTGLMLTAAGELLLPHASAMASTARAMTQAMSGLEAEPEGIVRIAAPPGAAVDLCPIVATEVRRVFAKVRLEILSDTHARDLMRHEADIAVRSVPTTTGDLLVRKLVDADLGLYASRAYVAGLPKRPRLAHLDFIGWAEELAHIPMARWIEANRVKPYAMTSNSFLVMRAAACADLGVVLVPGLQAKMVGLVEVKVRRPPLPEVPAFIVVHRALRNVPRIRVVMSVLDDAVAAVARGENIFERGWWKPSEALLESLATSTAPKRRGSNRGSDSA